MTGRIAEDAIRVVRDRVEADLVRHLDRVESTLLAIVVRQAGLARDIASGIARLIAEQQEHRDGGEHAQAGRPQAVKRGRRTPAHRRARGGGGGLLRIHRLCVTSVERRCGRWRCSGTRPGDAPAPVACVCCGCGLRPRRYPTTPCLKSPSTMMPRGAPAPRAPGSRW